MSRTSNKTIYTRVSLTVVIGGMLLALAGAGVNAAGFNFVDSAKEFFGMRPTLASAASPFAFLDSVRGFLGMSAPMTVVSTPEPEPLTPFAPITSVYSDNFGSTTSNTWTTTGAIGASGWSVLRSGNDWGGRRATTGQLEITNDTGGTANVLGWATATALTSTFASPYNATLANNPGQVTWTFNMRQPQADPGGFASGAYGVAFILAGDTGSDNDTGAGYAVTLGNTTTTDPVRLERFSAGLATKTAVLTSNTAGLTDFGAEYLSVKVTYLPASNTWELFVRNDGASAFADPAAGVFVSQGTAVNNLSTGTPLELIGGYWQGNTAAGNTAFFDNVTVTVDAVNETIAGTATATAPASGTSINVSMPYTGDNNDNNTYTVDYKLSADGSFTNWVTAATHAASPYATTITGLTPGSTYDVRVTYNDADGVTGTNPQTISSIVVPRVSSVTNWTRATGTTGPVTITNASFSCGAGSNRLLVAAVVVEYNSSPGPAVMTMTAAKGGGVNFTQAVKTSASARTGVWIGYLTESQIAGNANSIEITESGTGSWSSTDVFLACYSGVDQTTPIVSPGAATVQLASDTGATSWAFSNVPAIVAAPVIYAHGNNDGSAGVITPPSGWTEAFDVAGTSLTAGLGHKFATGTTESGTISWGSSQRHGNAIVALNPVAASVPPTVTTPTHAAVTTTGATLGANVTAAGSAAITARGTCWATTANPVANCVEEGTDSTGIFTHARTGLAANTTYFYRGYATSSAGTSYSPDGTFTTATVLAVTGPSNALFGTTPTVTNNGGGSGGGAITFSHGASTGCSVSGTTLTVLNTTLPCNITATRAAGGIYAAQTSASFPVTLLNASQFATVTNPSVPYNASQQAATVTCSGGGTAADIKYDGSSTAPTNAAAYAVTADCPEVVGSHNAADDTSAATFTITKLTPVITFGSAPSATFPGSNFTVSATSNNTDAAPTAVTYSVFSGPCTHAGGANFTPTGVGDCVVQADGVATTNFYSATAQQTVTIAVGAAPEIDVTGGIPPTPIADGDDAPTAVDGTDFGSIAVSAPGVTHTFTITNSGTADLTIGPISITSPINKPEGDTKEKVERTSAVSDFEVTPALLATLTPGQSTTFTVTFNPSFATTFSHSVSIPNGDSDEDPYRFDIIGVGLADQEINVAGTTSFPPVAVLDPASITQTYTIQNQGAVGLTFSTPTITTGPNPGDFTVSNVVGSSPIAGGGSATFDVTFNPSATGGRSATVSIINGDGDENPYQFTVSGLGTLTTQAPLTIDGPGSVTYGTTATVTFSANGSGTGAVTYSDGGTAGCDVGATDGVITVTDASGVCMISATKAADANYSSQVSNSFAVALVKVPDVAFVTNSPQSYTGNPINIVVGCASGGSATGINPPTRTVIGTTPVTASCPGNSNFSAVTDASAGSFTVNGGPDFPTVSNTGQGYTGSPITIAVSCVSGNAATSITPPTATAVGNVSVTASCPGGPGHFPISNAPAGTFVIVAVAPTVTSPTATDLLGTTATLGANVTFEGGASLTARGTCWNTTTPVVNVGDPGNNCAAEGSTAGGVFTQAVTGLPQATKIYYKGYGTNFATGYSTEGSFYTEPTTQASGVNFTAVTGTTMTVNWTRGSGDGVIVLIKANSAVAPDAPADGSYSIYSANPGFGSGSAIGSSYVIYKGSGTSVDVTGLTPGTTYYVEAFEFAGAIDSARNEEEQLRPDAVIPINQGTNYKTPGSQGGQVAAVLPTVTTQAATSITSSTATGNGNITSLGTPDPTQYGVVWGTSTNPTVALATKTAQGATGSTGAFTSSITGLTPNTLYYVRAYATNAAGTTYGNEVQFTSLQTFTLDYLAGSNGTLSGATAQTVDFGTSGSAVTASPAPNYHFVNWSDASVANPRTDSNVTSNVNVTANFAINQHTVTPSVGTPSGTISLPTPQLVNHGSTIQFTLTPTAGYHVVGATGTCGGALDPPVIAGEERGDGTPAVPVFGPRTFTTAAVNADCTVIANFAINTYTLTYNAGANGTITGTSPQTVNHGGSGAAVTASPNAGYHFVNWSDASTSNPRTDTNVTANITVTANFAINTYTLTYNAGANGTITGTTPQTVNHGANGAAVTASPNAGYHFVNWSDASVANPRTDTIVTANITVTANFAINTYTVTPSVGSGNGTIAPSTPQVVNHGSTTQFLLTPGPGHYVGTMGGTCPLGSLVQPLTSESERVEGIVNGPMVFTTGPVTANCTVIANFAVSSYLVAYNGNGNDGGNAPGQAPHLFGSTVTVLGNTGSLTKAGFSFGGWNTQADGLGTTYNAGDTFTMPANLVQLYAFWITVTPLIIPTITWADPADITYPTALSATQLNALASVPGTYIYTPPATTVLGAGNAQVLTVNFTPDDPVTYSSISDTALINVLQAGQTITVTTAAPANAFINTPFNVAATATSGLPVAITSSGACTGSGSGSATITMSGAIGVCTVNYNQAGDANYSAAPQVSSTTNSSGTITGNVNYGNGTSQPYPVPGVTITADHATLADILATSNASGNYTLSNFGNGPYTVTPSKPDQANNNGLTALDAARIAQHVVGVTPLTGGRLLGGDVTQDGTISALDAAFVAQFIVSIPFAVNRTGEWRFNPAVTTPNTTVVGVQDYTAILLGDASGDWNNGVAPRPDAIESPDAAQSSLPVTEAQVGSTVTVPLRFDNLNGQGVLSYQFDVEYDPAVVTPTAAAADLAGTRSEGLTVFSNAPVPGLLKVIVYGAVPVTGDGVYVNLRFNTIGGVGASTPLAIRGLLINDGDPPAVTVDGRLTLASSSSASGSIRGKVITPAGQGLRNARVVLTNSRGEQSVFSTSSFGRFEFNGLTVGETYTIAVSSKRYRFAPQVIGLTASLAELEMIALE